jgi:hypothetical protein
MGAPEYARRHLADGSAGYVTRLQRRVPTTELPWCGETCMPMICGKHYGCQGTRARCVGYKPTNTNPCPRVGYPALGAGHARERGSVHSIRTIAVQSLADNLYADVINFCSSAAPGLFYDLVAPVVRLTTESNTYKMQEGSFTRRRTKSARTDYISLSRNSGDH